MKYTPLIIIFFSIGQIFSQQLTPTAFNLNPGGYITDVEYFEPTNSYIIIGEFSSVNGQSRSKIAFLDESLSFLQNHNPILSSDGEFLSIAIKGNRIFVGGNFNTIQDSQNGNINSPGIVELNYNMGIVSSQPFFGSILPSGGTYSNGGVMDMEIYGDSLFCGGSFTTSALPIYYNLICYNLSNNQVYSNFANQYTGSNGEIFDIEKFGNHYYISGCQLFDGNNNNALRRVSNNGNPDPTFTPNPISANSPIPICFKITKTPKDNVIYAHYRHNSSNIIGIYNTNGITIFSPLLPSLSEEIRSIANYKNTLFRAQSGNTDFYSYYLNNNSYTSNWNSNHNNSAFNFFQESHSSLFVCRNRLFTCNTGISSFEGQNRTGLASFCLEPEFMTNFNDFDSSACAGLTIHYEIDSVKFASGYHWEYTGQGASIGLTPIDNGGANLIGEDKNSVNISFSSNFSPGYLIVKAFSDCGEITSDSTLLYISQKPLPQFTALSDTAITCKDNSILLFASNYNPVNGIIWYDFQNSPINQDSINVTIPGSYIFEITDSIGCKNFDTIQVEIDTIQPNIITLPVNPYINCQDSTITLYCSSDTSNTIAYWNYQNNQYMDSITTFNPGTFVAISEDTLNGCKDSVFISVQLNYTPPEFRIQNYLSIPSFSPLDTINCINDSIQLTALAFDTNHVSYWIDTNSNTTNTDTTVFSSSTLFLYSQNIISGCSGIKEIQIAVDTTKPNYTFNFPELTCSLDSVELSCTNLGFGTISEWSDSLNQIHLNPYFTSATGTYSFLVIDTLNGCSTSFDYILTRSSEINFQDTLFYGCKNDSILLYGTATGNQAYNYYWNHSSYGEPYTTMANQLDSVFVIAFNSDSSCLDSSYVKYATTPTPTDSFLIFKPCDNNGLGSINAILSNGIEPYSYSLDNFSYQNSSLFDSLNYGDYNLWVRDGYNCSHQYQFTIDSNSNSPEINFIISTYNQINDSIWISNITYPVPDSMNWSFPSISNIIDPDPINPIIQISDTGIYNITLLSYLGGCEYLKSKEIYISETDSTEANLYNNNGIESVNAYPNPTNQSLNLEIKFYKNQNCTIQLLSLQTSITEVYFQASDEIQTAFDFESLNLEPGIFIVRIIGEFETRHLQIIYTP